MEFISLWMFGARFVALVVLAFCFRGSSSMSRQDALR